MTDFKENLYQKELQISESKKTISELKQKLHKQEILASQQHREIIRLKDVENSFIWCKTRKLLDVVDKVIFPYHTSRGQFYFKILNRLKAHFENAPQSKQIDTNLEVLPIEAQIDETLRIDEIGNLTFGFVKAPKVSIIIPVWNKWRYSYNCLKSILENTNGVGFEVILVDNASTDETPEMLGKVKNIKVLKNDSNLGFVLPCNEGARNANGEYLLFLNNDTVVTKGWLKTMVEFMDNDKTIGAVGPKLIFSDGTLQEAGSIIWRDGLTLGYGRGENPDNPEFCYIKDVDYCSGACLLVRSDIFFALRGFDEVYSPAYYEDADLCLGIKSSGYRVVYCPEVKVFHHEFVSSVKEETTQLCLTNRLRFVNKWADEFKKYHVPNMKNILTARDNRKGKRVLVIDDIIPASHLGSGFQRMNVILKYLVELGYVVTFFPLSDPFPYQPYTRELQLMGIEVFYGENLDMHKFIQDRQGFYDIIYISRPYNADKFLKSLRKFFQEASIFYDAEAIYAVREIKRLELNGIEVSPEEENEIITKEVEVMKYADAIIVVSESERRHLAEFGHKNVFVWGYPLNINTPKKSFVDRHDLLFLGGFLQSPSPNEDAILYFVKHIFPKVKETLGCRLFIVGTNYLESIKSLESDSIIVTGYVEDVRDYYESSRIFLVPTRYAGGIPLKLLEAMSYGIPSVVTPLVATHLELSESNGILIGKDDRDFSEKIIRLFRDEDLWYELQKKALQFVSSHCNGDKLKQRLASIIERQ